MAPSPTCGAGSPPQARIRARADPIRSKVTGWHTPKASAATVRLAQQIATDRGTAAGEATEPLAFASADSEGTRTDGVDVIEGGDGRHDDGEPATAEAALSLKLVGKVDWKKFVEVYCVSPEETEALRDIATGIARKGIEATAVVQAGKEPLARAKKAKSGAKFKNGIRVAAAVEDVLLCRTENGKLTKPLQGLRHPRRCGHRGVSEALGLCR